MHVWFKGQAGEFYFQSFSQNEKIQLHSAVFVLELGQMTLFNTERNHKPKKSMLS